MAIYICTLSPKLQVKIIKSKSSLIYVPSLTKIQTNQSKTKPLQLCLALKTCMPALNILGRGIVEKV